MSDIDTADSIIDEVRQIRRAVSERCGNDLDQLFHHLRQVDREYADRQGIFAGVTPAAAAKVAAGWGDLSGSSDDQIVQAIRNARDRWGNESRR